MSTSNKSLLPKKRPLYAGEIVLDTPLNLMPHV